MPNASPSTRNRRDDPRWRSALGGDEARAAELGASVAPAELAEALHDDDAIRAVALHALPYAGDRDASLGALADALDRARGDEAAVADAIEKVLASNRRDLEMPSREGARRCAASLDRLAKEGGRPTLDASRAESLARRVTE